MENSDRRELECLICLDIMLEPVTTVCGHTFCKICLIRNLKIKLNCPMCREPILQSGENMKKNVIMENIIKSKFPREYQEKLKVKKLAYESELLTNEPNESSFFSFPAILIKDYFIWPGQIQNVNLCHSIFNNTISVSSVNDRNLLIIPYENFANKICCLCEIQNLKYEEENNSVNFDLVGKMRFKINNFQNINLEDNSQHLYMGTGEVVKDKDIVSEEKKTEILEKMKDIKEIDEEILRNCPYSVLVKLQKMYGKGPTQNLNTLPGNNLNLNNKFFETFSFYYLNIIKSDEKVELYETTDVVKRINWIHEKYKKIENMLGNESLSLNFYDLSIAGQPKNQLYFTILMIIAFLVFGFAYKMKWIRV